MPKNIVRPIDHMLLAIGVEMEEYNAAAHFYLDDAVYSLFNSPEWLHIDNATGILKGTPTEENFSTGIEVIAKNNVEELRTNEFSIYTLNKPEFIGSQPITIDTLVVGEPFNMNISQYFKHATDYEFINSPYWLHIDYIGNIYGIPFNEEVIPDFQIIAKNIAGSTNSGNILLEIISKMYFKGTIHDIYCPVGELYSHNISDRFNTGNIPTIFEIWNAPDWMSIDNTGTISGTPRSNYITTNIVVVATNKAGKAVSNIFTVQSVRTPMFVKDISNITDITGTPITPYDISSYVIGEHLRFTLQHAPDWLDIDDNGIITGIAPMDRCIFGIVVLAKNIAGRVISNTFNIEVSSMPEFSGNINNKLAIVDKDIYPFNVTPYFNAGGSPRSYKINGAPYWLSITKFGILQGKPRIKDKKVTNGITITGTNFVGSDTSDTFSVEVYTSPIFEFTISNMFLAIKKYMRPYDASKHFESGAKVLTYSLEGAPKWMSIDRHTGKITGYPVKREIKHNIVIVAKGAYATVKSNIFNCEIVDVPIFTGKINNIQELAYVPISDYDVSEHFSSGSTVDNYGLEGEPDWIHISNKGIIYGKPFPATDEYYKIKVIAYNIAGKVISNEFALDIDAVPLLVEDINNIEISIHKEYNIDISNNFNKDKVRPDTYEFIQAFPDWLSIDNNGIIHANSDELFQSCNVSVKAENRAGHAISNIFSIRVVDTPIFKGTIPDMYLETGKEMDPYALYQHFERYNGTMIFTLENAASWMYVDMDKIMGVPEHE